MMSLYRSVHLLPAALAVSLSACASTPASVTPPRAVELTRVEPAPALSLPLPARLRAADGATLSFSLPGTLLDVAVRQGDPVRAQDALARLDPEQLRLAVRRAQAEVQLAEAQALEAVQHLARTEALSAHGAFTEAQLESATARRATTASRVELARTALSTARDQARDGVLRAPYDGVVSARRAEPGQAVGAGQPIVELVGDGPLEVFVDVPESLLAELDGEVSHPVRVAAVEGEHVDATVAGVSASASPSGTYEVRLRLAGRRPDLRSGMTAEVQLRLRGERSLLIPATAFGRAPDGSAYALLVDDGHVVRRPVTLGTVRGAGVTVTGGLEAGERVVRRGLPFLAEGDPVRVLEPVTHAMAAR